MIKSSQRTCDGVVISNYHKKKCPQLMQKDHRRLTRTLRMCNKQTLPTARGQETCAHRYSSLLPHTDNMPTSKVHTEQKGDGSEQHFAKAITVFVAERGCKCWKELSKMQSTTVNTRSLRRCGSTHQIPESDQSARDRRRVVNSLRQ